MAYRSRRSFRSSRRKKVGGAWTGNQSRHLPTGLSALEVVDLYDPYVDGGYLNVAPGTARLRRVVGSIHALGATSGASGYGHLSWYLMAFQADTSDSVGTGQVFSPWDATEMSRRVIGRGTIPVTPLTTGNDPVWRSMALDFKSARKLDANTFVSLVWEPEVISSVLCIADLRVYIDW